MKSKLTARLAQDLLAGVRHLSPTRRLEAFLAHSRLMVELQAAARPLRSANQPPLKSTGT
jgi:hypothetical protein